MGYVPTRKARCDTLYWISVLLVGKIVVVVRGSLKKTGDCRQQVAWLSGVVGGTMLVGILWWGQPFGLGKRLPKRPMVTSPKVEMHSKRDRLGKGRGCYCQLPTFSETNTTIVHHLPKYGVKSPQVDAASSFSSVVILVGIGLGVDLVVLLVAGLGAVLLVVVARFLQMAIAKLHKIEAENQRLSRELAQRWETEMTLQRVNQHLEALLLKATNERLQQTQQQEGQYLQAQNTLLLFERLAGALVEEVSEKEFIERGLQWLGDRFFPDLRLTYIVETEAGLAVLGCVSPDNNYATRGQGHEILAFLSEMHGCQQLLANQSLVIENVRDWVRTKHEHSYLTITELKTSQAILLVSLPSNQGRDFVCVDAAVPRRWQEREISLLQQVGVYMRLARQKAALTQQLAETQRAKQEKEARFRQMAENVQEVFWVATPERKQVLYASRAYETIWGRQRQSLYEIPYAWLESIHSSDRQRVAEALTQPLFGDLTQEYRIVRPDGKVVWIRDRAFPIYDEKAEVSRIAGIATDISERKYAQMEAQLLQTINQSVHTTKDFAQTLTSVLKEICNLTGWEYAEAWMPEGKGLRCVCGWYGDRWELEHVYQHNLDLIFSLGEGLPGIVWQSGKAKWLHDRSQQDFDRSAHLKAVMEMGLQSGLGVPIVSNEQVVAVFLFFSYQTDPKDTQLLDLVATLANQLGLLLTHKQFETRLQEREEVLRLFVEHNPAAVAMLDRQMRYLVASRRWLQDYDLGDIDIVGRSHYDLFPNLATHWQTIHKSCLQGEVQSCEEEPFSRADGSLDWLRWEMHPWYDKTHIGGIIMFSEIITQRKQAEAELQRTNEQLQASVEKLEQNNQEITLLGQLSEILQACLHLEEAYKAIESFLPPLFPYCSGSVYILNRENYLADAIATWGTYVSSEAVFYPNDCWALRQWHPHFTNHSQDQLLCNHMHSEQVAESLCVPMTAQGKALGLLHLNAAQYGTLTEDRQQFAVTVSEHMSLALANLTLRETLQSQSICDSLTGLYNRRYLEEALEREIHRARRKTQSVGILMVDIDHFKRFNDNFGHEVGDAVLQEVGKLLMQNIRPGDIACRYGGEEMTLILPDTDLTVAKQRAEEIREAIKQLRLEYHPPQLGSITVSLGIACFPTHGSSGSVILQVADAALYAAKAQGRDRAVVAQTRGSA